MHMCERQAGTQSMHIQYSYNSNVSILLVSLLSRASGSLRTTPFHFFKKCFYTCRTSMELYNFMVFGAFCHAVHTSESVLEARLCSVCNSS